MGDKMKKLVENGTDSKYVPRGSRCGVCDKKFGFFATGLWSMNTRALADGFLCPACYEKLYRLLVEKRKWMSSRLQKAEPWKNYNTRTWFNMSVQEVRQLIALKEQGEQEVLAERGGAGALFTIREAFFIEANALQVGIARAKKIDKRLVVYGSTDEGEFEKGDTVRVDCDGGSVETTVVEAHLYDDVNDFDSTVKANMGRQRIPEGRMGWLILDLTEDIGCGDHIVK